MPRHFDYDRGPQRQQSGGVYRSNGSRKRRRRRKRTATLIVLAVTVVALFGCALLLSSLIGGGEPVVSSAPPVSSAPAVSQAPPQPVSSSLPPQPVREPTPWDEAELPPLFNFENYIPEDYRYGLGEGLKDVGGGHRMYGRAADAFLAMAQAAEADGITLVRLSGYRTHEHQSGNYNASIQRYLNEGKSQQEAEALTQRWYAIPGTSEHEAGLAMDVGDANSPGTNIDESFKDTPTYDWLQENCTTYGFILRYRQEDFDITHIYSEPWHYRYVGANHAEVIAERGITLEQYIFEMERDQGVTPLSNNSYFMGGDAVGNNA